MDISQPPAACSFPISLPRSRAGHSRRARWHERVRHEDAPLVEPTAGDRVLAGKIEREIGLEVARCGAVPRKQDSGRDAIE